MLKVNQPSYLKLTAKPTVLNVQPFIIPCTLNSSQCDFFKEIINGLNSVLNAQSYRTELSKIVMSATN